MGSDDIDLVIHEPNNSIHLKDKHRHAHIFGVAIVGVMVRFYHVELVDRWQQTSLPSLVDVVEVGGQAQVL